ncbi:MAG: NAD(P)-binding protein [Candidatus Omnitrophica bacterium]|jgi:protoporphyrinogen oxidase|nr:NAD(P)-binding protein [Candidatus Omnitrophota bacterium]
MNNKNKQKVIVLGGGISGLTAAWELSKLNKYDIVLCEKENRLGGLCGYYDFKGIKLDYGPHKVYSVIPGIMDEFMKISNSTLKTVEKKHKIILRGKLMDYPVKLVQLVKVFNPIEVIHLSISVLLTLLRTPFLKEASTYEEYCKNIFGNKIYQTVFLPLAYKVWGDPKELSAQIAKKRIPVRNMYDLVFRLLNIKKESKFTDASHFFYPQEGFYQVCDGLANNLLRSGHIIRTCQKPVKFIMEEKRIKTVVFDNKQAIDCDMLVSSIPLNEVTSLLFPDDRKINQEDNFLKMRHSMIAYFLIDKPSCLNDHWVFCPDKELVFSRISEQKLISTKGFPEDKTVICCDFTSEVKSGLFKKPDGEILALCVKGLEGLKIVNKNQVLDSCLVRIPAFYPVYELGFQEKKDKIFKELNSIENIIYTGRLGMSDYYNVDHCLDMAMFIAKNLDAGVIVPEINRLLHKRAEEYQIVD